MNTRPYIILNDKPSWQVQGLLIRSLPPVAMPKMRTQIEEIDGRDGDIVTPLGFAAYDKTVEIGLTYNYDIDDVISYFNSAGRVVFSNEPEKYYNFAIYDTIDFERLIRFRTAAVKFHVQPFKYSDVEGEKIFSFSGSSGNLTIRNSGNYKAKPNLIITGTETVNVSLNGNQIFIIDFEDSETITIDTENMNAYGVDGTLKNRKITGDYDNLVLVPGNNTISFIGAVTEIKINNYSRWL